MTKKNSIQIWVIALLVVLNLTTIGTIFYHNRQVKDNEAAVVIDESRAPLTGRYFRQTLRFDDEQMNAFRKANRQFQPQANLLIYEMDSLKTEMFIELNREQPDTIRLNSISDHIGRHHAELKKITNDFTSQLNRYVIQLNATGCKKHSFLSTGMRQATPGADSDITVRTAREGGLQT